MKIHRGCGCNDSELNIWFQANLMSLNIGKTKLIQFKTKHKSVSDIIINHQN